MGGLTGTSTEAEQTRHLRMVQVWVL